MNLDNLQSQLNAKAGRTGSVSISEAVIKDAQLVPENNFDTTIKSYLQLEGDLIVKTSAIAPVQNDRIVFSGPCTFLNLSDITVTIELYIADDKVNLILTSSLGPKWKFSDCFQFVVGYPFDDIILSNPFFILSTSTVSGYDVNGTKTDIKTGLNFLSDMDFSGPLEIITPMLKGISKTDRIKVTGTIDPTHIDNRTIVIPDIDISAGINAEIINFPYFKVTDPRVAIRIVRTVDNDHYFKLYFIIKLIIDDQLSFGFQVALLKDFPILGIHIIPDPSKPVTPQNIVSLLAGNDFTQSIPSELKSVFSAVALRGFALNLFMPDIKLHMISAAIGSTGSWNLCGFEVKDMAMIVSVTDPLGEKKTNVSFEADIQFLKTIFPGDFNLQVLVSSDGGLICSAGYEGTVSLNKIIDEITDHLVKIPDELLAVTFSDFGVDFSKQGNQYRYHLYGSEQTTFDVDILGGKVETNLDISFYSADNRLQLFGGLRLGDFYFALLIDLSKAGNIMTATWKTLDDESLGINDILHSLGFTSIDIPEGVDLGLKEASLSYDFTKKTLVIEAESTNYGKAVFVASKSGDSRLYYFGINVDTNINLSNLPLVGKALSSEQTLAIQEIRFAVSSDTIDSQHAAAINNLIKDDYPKIPAAGILSGMSVSLELDFGGQVTPLSIGTSSPASKTAAGNQQNTDQKAVVIGSQPGKGCPGAPAQAQAMSDGTVWFNIQKTFGPVSFQRVGVKYKEGILWFLLDASMSMSGLTISVLGLAAGSPLTTFSPHFDIEGLGIDFHKSGLDISGAFMKIDPKPPVTMEFGGAAVIKVKSFSVEAVGAYADVGGTPSMFVFASVTGAFGGPPYFFVTGFACGFGYNSRLRIPGQNEIFNFPLVAGLSDPDAIGGMNPTPLQALSKLLGDAANPGWVTQTIGEIWLAAGIKFTSFKLVNSTALLIAEFGNDLSFALIGLSRARFPMEGSETYAFIELQLKAVVNPDEGFMGFSAVLSPNSYVIDKNCKLTGGFAFYIWFGPNEHAGDFVLTLGGYSPYFDHPEWYPDEPRLGLNWAISSHVSITGEAYFAMTPSAIMAGGKLDLRFHAGNLQAWLTAWADIVIWWNPFRFYANIGVSVGASYTLDLLFVSKTFSVELGADLQLWGPETGGKVRVHWWIISFTIDFGSDPPSPADQIQSWEQFSKVLPDAKDAVKILPVKGLNPSQPANDKINGTQQALSAAAKAGEPDNAGWIVRADNFQFTANSAFPVTTLYVGDKNKVRYATGDKLNIQPMQQTGLESFLQIYIYLADGSELNLLDPAKKWSIDTNLSHVPKALWGTGSSGSLTKGNEQLVNNQLTGVTITAPSPISGSSPGNININDSLSYDPLSPGTNPLKSGQLPDGPIPIQSDQTISFIKGIMDTQVKSNRDAIFSALKNLNTDIGSNDDLTRFGSSAGSSFIDEPLLLKR